MGSNTANTNTKTTTTNNNNNNNNNGGGPSTSGKGVVPPFVIPASMKKTIGDIKEITGGNHSEEDIFAMLRECHMDPSETIQRLLHLDTFHEVKRKRDKKKEVVNDIAAEESRSKPGYQGRGTRGGRGSSYSQYASNDLGGWRNGAGRKENGAGEYREKGYRHPAEPVSKNLNSAKPQRVEKSSSPNVNGPVKVPNVVLGGGVGHGSRGVDSSLPKGNSLESSFKLLSVLPKVSVEQAPSTSDPVLKPSRDGRIPTAVGAIEHELRTQKITSEPKDSNNGRGVDSSTAAAATTDVHLDQHVPENVDDSEKSSSTSQKEAVSVPPKILGVEEAASKLEKTKFSDGQHVIIPNHINVPDAVKNVLSFGSFGANFDVNESHLNMENDNNSNGAVDLALDETANMPASCDQEAASSAVEENETESTQSSPHSPGKENPSNKEVSSSATVPTHSQLVEETLPAVGPPFPIVHTAPGSFGFGPAMLPNPLVQPGGLESQAHISNSLSGSSPVAQSTSTSSLPPTQSHVTGQATVAVSPQPVPLFRQAYPPNYIPYGPYFSPFYVPPTMHQYYGNAFPTPLASGNVYLPPPTPGTGVKHPLTPYKPGPNTGIQTPVGMPSAYAAYNSTQVGYNQNVAVTNSSSSDELAPSALKSEAPTVWFPATVHDAASFPLNYPLNLPPQGQHVMAPQPGHGGFAVFHTMQPMSTSMPGLQLLQQSQAIPGSVESIGPPSNVYQQPQRQQQMNWNM